MTKFKPTPRPAARPAAPAAAGNKTNPTTAVALRFEELEARIDRHLTAMLDAVAQYEAELVLVGPKAVVPQAATGLAFRLGAAVGVVGKAVAAFRDFAAAHRDGGGKFAVGLYAIVFGTSAGKRNPKWKEVAIAQAQRVAALTGKKFDADKFAEGVIEKTPVSGGGNTTVEIVVANA